ncbi:MAG: membrane protein insertase YidC [Bacteroidia bacterium]
MSTKSSIDRNTLTGLFLMGLILVLYSLWFPPAPAPSEKPGQEPTRTETVAEQRTDTTKPSSNPSLDTAIGTGPWAMATRGTETTHTLSNGDLTLEFTSKGGVVRHATLNEFKTYRGEALRLFDSLGLRMQYALVTDQTIIRSDQCYFQAVPVSEPGRLDFVLQLGEGQRIIHRYQLDSSGYRLSMGIRFEGLQGLIRNDYTTLEWTGTGPSQERDLSEERKTLEMVYRFRDEDPESMGLSSENQEDLRNNLQWISFRQKFFCAVLGADQHFDGAKISGSAEETPSQTGKFRAEITLDLRATSDQTFGMWMYLGPNHFQTLKSLQAGLEQQIPLGWGLFGWVNRFLVIPVFNWLDTFGWNYGWIILALTLIIKILLFPLTYKSLVSGAKMKVLKPEIDELKTKYEKDPTRMQSEQMKLFQKAGVNPLGGCLPMLLQLPILIALFNFFPASIELRQQAFLWADDLSTYDSILDLPFSIPFYGAHVSLFTLLMTASTLLYTRLSNQMSGVTGQMKVMGYVMPLMFIPVLNSYSAALSYYYFLANMVSFAQQWLVRRFVINEEALLRQIEENKKKPLKKSSFQQKMEDLAKKARENRNTPNKPRKS